MDKKTNAPKKKLILVGAPPACGKNYVSRLLCRELGQVAYLDKDDLGDLLRAGFALVGKEPDMDGGFYRENLRAAEYRTLLTLAFSALEFSDAVLVNAPFLGEVRDAEYMRALRARANGAGAELILVWVTASEAACYGRMKARGSERDRLKLASWAEYAATVDRTAPTSLAEQGGVDRLIVFDNENGDTAAASLGRAMAALQE